MNTLVRRQADFENYRKRVEKRTAQDRHRGTEVLIEQMLPVLDAFDLRACWAVGAANAEYRKGFEMIRTQMWNALAKQGLKPIRSGRERVRSESAPRDRECAEGGEPEGTVSGGNAAGLYVSRARVASGDGACGVGAFELARAN